VTDSNYFLIVEPHEVTVECHKFKYGFSTEHKEILTGFFYNFYQGQKIIVNADDGENVEQLGIVNFFSMLCEQNIIEKSAVTFKTYHDHWPYDFCHQKCLYHIFKNTKQYLHPGVFDLTVDTNAKFLGLLIGRFSPSRFDLAYNIDRNFINDNFLIFGSPVEHVQQSYSMVNGAYQSQLDWLRCKQFDQDQLLADQGGKFLSWMLSLTTYHHLWPQYYIECVAETDENSADFFTEKTSRCLATGKPFVLYAGAGSLARLRKFGFLTFDSVLDESYDNASSPQLRQKMIFDSLLSLYYDSDKNSKIKKLYHIAKINQLKYDNIVKPEIQL
jgi:hypothetical protein